MGERAELKLPTVAVPVRLALVGQGPVAAELFVVDATRSDRAQLVDDLAALLEEDTSFLPVRFAAGVKLIAKHAVAWLAIDPRDDRVLELEPAEVEQLYDREYHVVIELAAGGAISGTLFDSSPADRPRVVDHLNRAGRFVRLWTDDAPVLVNKANIVRVTELTEAP